jgi:hypothetical protein
MNIRQYFSSSYNLLKMMFSKAATVENSVLVGAVRERIVKGLMDFFPEIKIQNGWICDLHDRHTGEVDIILPIRKALRIPGLLMTTFPGSGIFANQVFATIEVKSHIRNKIKTIIKKTWECHRLVGGFGNITNESFENHQVKFQFKNWVPHCVIGNYGFKDISCYLKNFEKFETLHYSINKRDIEKPDYMSQVVPDLLLDFTYDTLLILRSLEPELIIRCFQISPSDVHNFGDFTIFTNMQSGQPLMVLVYYLNVLRSDVSGCQLTAAAPLLELFKSKEFLKE